MRALTKLLAVLLASSLAVSAQSRQPDLTKEPTLYVVAYSHLDTQWRWEYPRVINEYIPKTLHDNFALLDKYPQLRLQLQRRESLSHDEGILAGGLCAVENLRCRGSLVSGGFVDGRRRREFSFGRIDLSPDTLRQSILPT